LHIGVLSGLDDNVGTICDLTYSNGTLVLNGHVEYDAFGEPVSNAPVADFLFGLDGLRYDPVTQEYRTERRVGDPNTNDFLSQDPSQGGGSNRYSICKDNHYVALASPNQ